MMMTILLYCYNRKEEEKGIYLKIQSLDVDKRIFRMRQ